MTCSSKAEEPLEFRSALQFSMSLTMPLIELRVSCHEMTAEAEMKASLTRSVESTTLLQSGMYPDSTLSKRHAPLGISFQVVVVNR